MTENGKEGGFKKLICNYLAINLNFENKHCSVRFTLLLLLCVSVPLWQNPFFQLKNTNTIIL